MCSVTWSDEEWEYTDVLTSASGFYTTLRRRDDVGYESSDLIGQLKNGINKAAIWLVNEKRGVAKYENCNLIGQSGSDSMNMCKQECALCCASKPAVRLSSFVTLIISTRNMLQLLPNTDITRSNTSRYWLQHNHFKWHTLSKIWTHSSRPISRPDGRAMGSTLSYMDKKVPRYIDIWLYIFLWYIMRSFLFEYS